MRFLLTLTIFSLLSHGGLANDWPQWRGADGSGVSQDSSLPQSWSEDSGLAWKARLAGQGVSSPIVWGDLVIATSQAGRGVMRPGNHPTLVRGGSGDRFLEAGESPGDKVFFLVEAFDRSSGRLRWSHKFEAGPELAPVHQKSNLASSSPVADGERVYAWFGTGQLVALDAEGKLVWERHIAQQYSPFSIAWGHASSPTVYKDLLILLCDHDPASYLLALDAKTGEERWKADRGQGLRSYSTPLVISADGKDELIVNSSHRLEAYDPATGELLWHTGESNRFPVPVPSFHEGVIYTSRGYRSGPYMAIRPGGRGDVSESHVLWRVATGAPYVSSIVHYQGVIYMANGQGVAKAVDASNGETLWQERIGGVYSASPVAGDGKVYFFSESGEAVVVQAGRQPQVLARNQLEGRFLASPAIAGGRIFVRTDHHLYSLEGGS